jgi:ketosteroid isomerase-like protein
VSQENVDAMRTAMDAFNRRDGAAMAALLHEDAEIVPVRAALEGTVYRGRGAGTQYCAAVDDRWKDLRWEVEQVRDEGEWALAVGRIHGQGRDSGVDIDSQSAWIAQFRDGLIAHFQTYANRGEGLRAAAQLRRPN